MALRWPAGPGIRVDAGIRCGDDVTGRFDPMLAKIVAHGSDRAEALDRLATALDESLVLGLTTNLRFLRWLVRQPAIRDGDMRVDTLERIWPPTSLDEMTAIPDSAWAVAAERLLAAGASAKAGAVGSPWTGGWRLNGPRSARMVAEGTERQIALHRSDWAADWTTQPATERATGSAVPSAPERRPERSPESVLVGDEVMVDVGGRSVTFALAGGPDVDRAAQAAAGHRSAGSQVIAPMPGTVLVVHALAGDSVGPGDPIVTLEAMKMEHVVVAPQRGTIDSLSVAAGDQVARGQVLAVVTG